MGLGFGRETESEMHTSKKSSKWRIYRTKSREIDCDGSDMSKAWMHTEYKNDYWKCRGVERDPGEDHKHGG
jgi:hypothetical protein